MEDNYRDLLGCSLADKEEKPQNQEIIKYRKVLIILLKPPKNNRPSYFVIRILSTRCLKRLPTCISYLAIFCTSPHQASPIGLLVLWPLCNPIMTLLLPHHPASLSCISLPVQSAPFNSSRRHVGDFSPS